MKAIMARCATQKGMKKVWCSRFSVVPFSNLKGELADLFLNAGGQA